MHCLEPQMNLFQESYLCVLEYQLCCAQTMQLKCV
jgi:hypothetical protein